MGRSTAVASVTGCRWRVHGKSLNQLQPTNGQFLNGYLNAHLILKHYTDVPVQAWIISGQALVISSAVWQ